MSYKLYTDKSENFECEVSVKNASLKGSIARLVAESSDGINLVFNGTIKDGKCNIPLRRVKGLLDENSKGTITLEIIVEDTYFTPWKSDFIVEEHTAVKVKINEQAIPSKPVVSVRVPSTHSSKPILHTAAAEIAIICEQFRITKKNITTKSVISSRRKDFTQVVKEYFAANQEYNKNKREILQQLSLILT